MPEHAMPSALDQPFLLWIGTALAAAALISAAAEDLGVRTIPNRLIAVVAASGLVLLHALGPAAFGLNLAVALAGLALGAVAFARGLAGGGDVKLLAATLLWAGPDLLSLHLSGTALAAVVMGVAMLGRQALAARGGPAGAPPADLPTMPFGVAIAAGGLLVLLARAGLLGPAAA